MALEFTDQNWDKEVMQSELPVLVDFFAEWCGPCKMMGPIIEKLATEYQGKMKIGKLNIDENEKPAEFMIQSIPTLIFIKNGEVAQAPLIGYKSEEELRSHIEKIIA